MFLSTSSFSKGVLLLLLLVFVIASFQSNSNQPSKEDSKLKADTLQAGKLWSIAGKFNRNAQYDSSLIYFQQVEALYRPHSEKIRDTIF